MNRRRMGKLTFGFVVVLSAIAGPAAPQDLPLGHRDFMPSAARPVGWRGDGSGVFPGATPPVQWNGPKGENVLWSVPCPHVTYASPIVVGNRVITLADPHTILCHDADSGKLLWHNASDTVDLLCKDAGEAKRVRRLFGLYDFYFSSQGLKQKLTAAELEARTEAMAQFKAAGVPPPPKDPPGNDTAAWDYNPFFARYGLWSPTRNGVCRTMATPVSDGKHVWVYWMSNAAACYDLADGKLVWMKYLGELKSCPGGLFFPSPVLVDGVLVVKTGLQLRGLQPATGEPVWELPLRVWSYSCSTPAVMNLNGTKVVVNWAGPVVAAKDGRVLLPNFSGTRERGCSSAVGGKASDILVLHDAKMAATVAVRLRGEAGQVTARTLWSLPIGPQSGEPPANALRRYDDDDGTSCCYGDYWYVNDGWSLVELETGKITHRELPSPSGGYPGINVAGGHVFNFDAAASCGVLEPGPDGKVVAVNHLLAGFAHSGRAVGGKGGNRSLASKACNAAFWKHVEDQAAKGVIGWVGRRQNLTLGEMTADPFFHGGRIYVRTYTHLFCIGSK